ncbi:Transcriptional regulator PadR-like family protein [Natronoarchaeum philippinense]|uniref:Transcriptional regulator PadR-like family protein n=1 Tax=Natronoarchaeum philippinense TaxID=558529 RepID=A0A285P947_NATPI|nr:PadR family transcriptional regulator [Natronoarchaeum philippinense]SNZ18252.1 Transcriptional regulator PadR-like family protein [Natronoarchaeum philippinense]
MTHSNATDKSAPPSSERQSIEQPNTNQATTTLAAHDLTAFQRHILTVLDDGRQHGLGVKADLEDLYGKEVNHGRLYPNLDELVGLGFVDKSDLDGRTNEYELTDAGHDALVEQAEWELQRVAIQNEGDA